MPILELLFPYLNVSPVAVHAKFFTFKRFGD
jgi:hypothetical protein